MAKFYEFDFSSSIYRHIIAALPDGKFQIEIDGTNNFLKIGELLEEEDKKEVLVVNETVDNEKGTFCLEWNPVNDDDEEQLTFSLFSPFKNAH